MTIHSEELATRLHQALKLEETFHLAIAPDWKSAGDRDHRLPIRDGLLNDLLKHFGREIDAVTAQAILDLRQPPSTERFSISISHTPVLGGYVWTLQPHLIGFDLEVCARVTPEIARRIAQPGELEQAPTPAALWVAKEAVFKCLLNQHQPKILTSVEIKSWETINSETFLFRAKLRDLPESLQGLGATLTIDGVQIGLFFMNRSK